jgi:hypothetical protein
VLAQLACRRYGDNDFAFFFCSLDNFIPVGGALRFGAGQMGGVQD